MGNGLVKKMHNIYTKHRCSPVDSKGKRSFTPPPVNEHKFGLALVAEFSLNYGPFVGNTGQK